MKILQLTFLFAALALGAQAQWIKQTVNTAASFRGLAVVSEKVIWASGTAGTVIKTTDSGKTWNVMTVPGAEKLDFRDIEAFDANTAYILSIGNGDASRIYKTEDGGKAWQLQFTNTNEKAFFDAIACWNARKCIAMSDPVDGKYVLISTSDGNNWKSLGTDKMAAAATGEAAFAASGTCLIVHGRGYVFLVTGGNDARVFRSDNLGLSWFAYNTPITKGTPGSGIFSIAMRDPVNGVIVGGNYEDPNNPTNTIAFTTDGGGTWKMAVGLTGYRSAVAYIDKKTLIAVGTNGTDLTTDNGTTWNRIANEDLNAVAAKGRNSVWAVGPKGMVAKLGSNVGKKPSSQVGTPRPINVHHVSVSRDQVSISCAAAACQTVDIAVTADDAPDIEYIYKVSAGRIVGAGPNVKWDLSGVRPGRYTVTAAVDDGGPWGPIGMTRTNIITVIE